MKTIVYLLAGIGLVAFGVHVYNDAGTTPMAPTPMVAESRVVVTSDGWSAGPMPPASQSVASAKPQVPVIAPPKPVSQSVDSANRPVIAPPMPAQFAEVRAPQRGDYEVSNFPVQTPVNASTQWGAPAQVQVTVHDSWMDGAESFTGVIILFGLSAILFVVIRSMRRGRAPSPSDETALVHELARRAQDLSQRMEALETILLDRTRATR